MSDRWTDRLSEYLDGELQPEEREDLQAHLFTCAACARTLAELRRVVERARALPDREPPRDLWPVIAAAMGEEDPALHPHDPPVLPLEARSRARDGGGRRLSFSLPQLAAAVLALVVASAGSVWLVQRNAAGPDRAVVSDPAAPPAVRLAADEPALTGAEVDAAIADLERRLAQERDRLDPATIRVLEENLRTIDQAVADARRALAADPGNAYVSGHLAATVRRKLDLLRRANEIATAQT